MRWSIGFAVLIVLGAGFTIVRLLFDEWCIEHGSPKLNIFRVLCRHKNSQIDDLEKPGPLS